MNKKELQDILKSNGVKNYSRMNKTELKKYIKEKLNIDVDEDKKEKKKKEINYGITPLKYGERRPTEIEALKKNQVRYWGLNKLDESFIKKAKVQGSESKLRQKLVELTAQMKGITKTIQREKDDEKKKKLQERAKKLVMEYKKIKQDLEGSEEKKEKEVKENIPLRDEEERKIPSLMTQEIINRALKEIGIKESRKLKGVEGLKARAKAKGIRAKAKMGTLKLRDDRFYEFTPSEEYKKEIRDKRRAKLRDDRFSEFRPSKVRPSEKYKKDLARDKRRTKLRDDRFYELVESMKQKRGKGIDKSNFFF